MSSRSRDRRRERQRKQRERWPKPGRENARASGDSTGRKSEWQPVLEEGAERELSRVLATVHQRPHGDQARVLARLPQDRREVVR